MSLSGVEILVERLAGVGHRELAVGILGQDDHRTRRAGEGKEAARRGDGLAACRTGLGPLPTLSDVGLGGHVELGKVVAVAFENVTLYIGVPMEILVAMQIDGDGRAIALCHGDGIGPCLGSVDGAE